MSRSYENLIFTCLPDKSKEFVIINAKCEEDILPLCTYLRQLEMAGRLRPRNWILNQKQLEKIRLCYQFSVPEPGTNFGIIMCKNFLVQRQQDNFDIKKPKSIMEKKNDQSLIFYSNPQWKEDVDNFMSTSKYEMILAIKNTPVIYMSFLLETNLVSTIEDFITHILNDILRFAMAIQIMEFTQKKEYNDVYFVVYVQKKMEDYFLQKVYGLFEISKIHLVFTSNRLFFTERDLQILNSVTFLYCFLTDRYKPERETENDEICNFMAKLISTVQFEIGGKSLKRNGLSKCNIGPLNFVVFEAGLLETAKKNGTLDYPTENQTIKKFQIESPFERMFMNLPIKNGILFQDYQFKIKE